jgi:hypothetical protein
MPVFAPIVPGRPCFAKRAQRRQIGIQLGSISLYDAGEALPTRQSPVSQ